ncbi:MAG: twin-arginine translocase subunit TatC [Planctomycetota bacterium]
MQPEIYSKYRKHMLVGALVMGAIFTPPDPYTQILMAVPIVLLYEIGLRFAWRLRPTPISFPRRSRCRRFLEMRRAVVLGVGDELHAATSSI